MMFSCSAWACILSCADLTCTATMPTTPQFPNPNHLSTQIAALLCGSVAAAGRRRSSSSRKSSSRQERHSGQPGGVECGWREGCRVAYADESSPGLDHPQHELRTLRRRRRPHLRFHTTHRTPLSSELRSGLMCQKKQRRVPHRFGCWRGAAPDAYLGGGRAQRRQDEMPVLCPPSQLLARRSPAHTRREKFSACAKGN